MVLDTSLLNTQQYKVRIKGKEVAPSLYLGTVAIEKESLLVVLDNGRQLYVLVAVEFANREYLILSVLVVFSLNI